MDEFMRKKLKTECLIDGQKVDYDGCSISKLEEAKDFYKESFKYIGSGYIYFIEGTRNESKNLHHFFIFK